MQEQVGGLIQPDFSEVKDNVEAGAYKARVVDAKIDQWAGKEGKNPTSYINWTLETYGEAEAKNNGRKIFHKTPINGPGAFRLKEFYKAAIGEECPASGFDMAMLFGKEVELTVVDGKNKAGELTGYTEVKAVKPVKMEQ
jgi:hypothetical protein